MPDFLKRYATPLVTGLFIVSLVSGAALFFHFGSAAFRGMHEWLSMVLIVPFVLHLWRNWRSMLMYVGRAPFTVAMVSSLVAALAFAYPAMTGTSSGRAGGPPPFQLAQTVIQHSPQDVAPILGLTTEELVATLKSQGYAGAASDLPMTEIATKAGKSPTGLMEVLLHAKK